MLNGESECVKWGGWLQGDEKGLLQEIKKVRLRHGLLNNRELLIGIRKYYVVGAQRASVTTA